MLLGPRVGVDFSRLLRRDNDPAKPRAPVLQDPAVRDLVPLFPTDVLRAISEHDLPGLLRWLVHPGWWRELGWHDRRLLAHNLGFVVRFAWDKLRRYRR